MIQISRSQALNRYDLLQENLKDSLFSAQNAEIIRRVCASHHLTEDKTVIIGKIVGYIIMGFIHPEDLAGEIKNALNINPEIAASISREIDRKIFSPIRNDIDKVYSPLEGSAEEHIIDLRKVEEKKEVEPLKEEVVAPEKPEDKPVIIHQEAEIKPTAVVKKSLGGLFSALGAKKEEAKAPKPVAAEVQIAGEQPPKEEVSKPAAPPRVVHYTELRTSLTPPAPAQAAPTTPTTPTPPTPQQKTEKPEEKKEEIIDLKTLKKI